MQRVWLCQFIKKKQNSLNPHNQLYFSSDDFFRSIGWIFSTKTLFKDKINWFFFFGKKIFFIAQNQPFLTKNIKFFWTNQKAHALFSDKLYHLLLVSKHTVCIRKAKSKKEKSLTWSHQLIIFLRNKKTDRRNIAS
jgi:hypothetical protein